MSDDAQAQLATLKANNAADATALADLEADLTTPATDSVGDQFLANAVSFLEGQGYTVTVPGAASEASSSTESADAAASGDASSTESTTAS